MGTNETVLHSSAAVHPKAQLDSGIHIGPFSYIGENVKIHKNTRVEASVCVTGWTEIGEECHLFSHCVVGTEPQDYSYQGDTTRVVIGNRNVFREFMTVHRGTVKGGGLTQVGDDNYFMAYSHIAHDCIIGDHTVLIHGATLGGHCQVNDYAQVGAFTGVHQFCQIGKYAFIGGYSVITQDVLPFCKVAGSRPPHLYGMNAIGLRRLGFSRERLQNIKAMFKVIFYSELNTSQAQKKIEKEFLPGEDRDEILSFIQSSKRGLLKKTEPLL